MFPQITLNSIGEIIIAGKSSSDSSGEKSENSFKYPNSTFNTDDIWIMKLDTNGNLLWDKTYGGDLFESSINIVSRNNRIYISSSTDSDVSGNKNSPSKGDQDIWLICTDMNGNKLWEKSYGGSLTDGISSVSVDQNHNLTLYGISNSNISGDKNENRVGSFDSWVINTDSVGNIQWQKTIGGNNIDALSTGFRISPSKYILAGFSLSGISGDKTEPSRGNEDFWLVELTLSTVGIFESKKQFLDFKIYPNPAKEFLNVSVEEKGTFGIEIYTTLGELVVQENMNGNTKQLNVSHLAEGSYILKLISEEGVRSSVFVK